MKKFSVFAAALAAAICGSGEASAQCGGGGCGGPSFFGGGRVVSYFRQPSYSGCGSSCQTQTYYLPASSCQPTGYQVQVQPQPSYYPVTPVRPVVMPAPETAYTVPYVGPGTPVPAPPTKVGNDPAQPAQPLPPKKLQAPNPKQEGFDSSMLFINGWAHGRLADGSYAMIADGTYSRLTGTNPTWAVPVQPGYGVFLAPGYGYFPGQ